MANFIEEIIDKDLESGKVKTVTTRFPPEPNGYLHIGHAKAICLNIAIAAKYGGQCNLRFDDTNPVKEEDEFVESITRDVKWLGWEGKVFFASDYFPVMVECAIKLIMKGKAYVDDMSAEDMRINRGTLTEGGKESKNRNRPKEESLALFLDMKNGKCADGSLVLRAKIDMNSPNINMRDPIIYRVLKAEHHRQGGQWNIYPMYDFAHPIEDAVENISHSICTLEFADHRPLYDWVLNECEFANPPHQYEFARLNIKRTIMSKRYLKKLVDEKIVDGWDDPRMPTLAGLRRRGYTPESLRTFCEQIGVSKANSEVEVYQLESCIREQLNRTAERAMAVLDPIELVIVNRSEDFSENLEFETLPNSEDKRTITISNKLFIERSDFELAPPPKFHRLTLEGMVRLKSGYIIKAVDYKSDENGKIICVYAEIMEGTKSGEDNSGIKVKGVIHWVNAKDCIKSDVIMFDYLLIDGEEDKPFDERINPNSKKVLKAVCEKRLESAENLERFQFMRQGYFVKDDKSKSFNLIVGLKDNYTKQ